MYKDEYKAVCNSAATKLNLLKTHPLGYFVASMLAGMFVAMGGFLGIYDCRSFINFRKIYSSNLGKTGGQSAAQVLAAALSLKLSWQELIYFTGNTFLMPAAFRKLPVRGSDAL